MLTTIQMHRWFAVVLLVGTLGLTGDAGAQVTKVTTTVKHRPTFVDADLAKIAAYVGTLTSRTIELGPRVCALVTSKYDKPQTPEQLYSSFVEIARAMGYIVVEDGLLTKVQLAEDTPAEPPPACRQYPVRNRGEN